MARTKQTARKSTGSKAPRRKQPPPPSPEMSSASAAALAFASTTSTTSPTETTEKTTTTTTTTISKMSSSHTKKDLLVQQQQLQMRANSLEKELELKRQLQIEKDNPFYTPHELFYKQQQMRAESLEKELESSSHAKKDLLVEQQQLQMRAESLEKELELKRQLQIEKDNPNTPKSKVDAALDNPAFIQHVFSSPENVDKMLNETETSLSELLYKDPMDYTGEHLMKACSFKPLLKSNEKYMKLYNSSGINLEEHVKELQTQRTQARMDLENLKATESILSLLSVSDLTPDEKGQVIRNATGSSLFVAANNNNNNVFNELITYYNNGGSGGYLKSNDDGNEGSRNGGEITFVDFRNHLLDSGQVDKIVVVNNNLARVILYPGSKGIPHNNHDTLSSSSSSSAGDSRSNRSRRDGGHAADNTILEFNKSSSTNNTIESSSSASESLGSSSSTGNNTPVYHFYIGSVESFEEKLSKAQSDVHPREWVPVQYVNEVNLLQEFIKITPMLALGAILFYYSRGLMGGGAAGGAAGGGGGMGGMFQVGKSNAKKVNPETVNINFDDVAGCTAAKQEVMEFVQFLSKPEQFTKLGAKIPKGALLCGPPGTGKTLLAKAVAGEAGVPFYSISGSDFIEMFVGVGPSRVRDLFKEARANTPCIIFIDEIDAVGRQRGRGGFSGGNDERENTLNQLLVEMDGFSSTTGVVVLAGTNRPDILDQALTRPGRFDRQITVDLPDLQGRKEIYNVHLKGLTLEGEKELYSGRLAGLTPGFAGADIANLCNEAAIVAARRKGESVSFPDFEKATDRVIGGLESNKIMSDRERKIVAYHEAGHAVAGWFLEHADPLLKVTIIPRASGALGFAQYLPKEVFLRTQEQIMDIVCKTLAGRAAEDVFFGRVTTGASDDLKRVTQMVYSTIQTYGMNSRVGQLAYPQNDDGMPGDKPYSDSTAEAMDEEARAIVDAAYQRTVELIQDKKEEVERVAEMLLEKETITHDDIIDLIGERPFKGDTQYNEYISQRTKINKNDSISKEDEESAPDGHDSPGGLTPGLA